MAVGEFPTEGTEFVDVDEGEPPASEEVTEAPNKGRGNVVRLEVSDETGEVTIDMIGLTVFSVGLVVVGME